MSNVCRLLYIIRYITFYIWVILVVMLLIEQYLNVHVVYTPGVLPSWEKSLLLFFSFSSSFACIEFQIKQSLINWCLYMSLINFLLLMSEGHGWTGFKWRNPAAKYLHLHFGSVSCLVLHINNVPWDGKGVSTTFNIVEVRRKNWSIYK